MDKERYIFQESASKRGSSKITSLLKFGKRNSLEKTLTKTEAIERRLKRITLVEIRLAFGVEIAKEEKSITTHK